MGNNIIDLAALITTQNSFMLGYYNYISKTGEGYGLNEKETDILAFFLTFPECDTQTDVVRLRGYSKSQASKSIGVLISKGFAYAEEDKNDARILHIKMTDKARELALLLFAKKSEFYEKALKGFSDDEIEEINLFVKRMNENLALSE